jgi:hypothetical protein
MGKEVLLKFYAERKLQISILMLESGVKLTKFSNFNVKMV